MIGYRKFAIQIFAIVAGLILAYLNKDAISEQFIAGGTNIIAGIFDLIVLFGVPQGGAAIYNRANIKAKEAMAKSNGAPVSTFATALSFADSVVAPLDIERLLEEAERLRVRVDKYLYASTEEIGLYYAYRDIGNVTRTTNLQHCLEYYDKLFELSQLAWLAETEKALGKGKGFAWGDRELPENLEKGFSPGCHAMSAYSWARKFNLAGLYMFIQNEIANAKWLEVLAENYPNIDLAVKLETQATLYRVGSQAMALVQGQQNIKQPKFKITRKL